MKKLHYTARQYRLAAGIVLAMAAPAIAQVPPLNLPALPPPPGATNPDAGSSNATGVPPLMIPVPGPSAVAEPKKETKKAANASKSINPTDMLPPEMLKEAGVVDEEEDAPTDVSKTDENSEDGDDNDTADANDGDDAKDDDSKTADTDEATPPGPPAPLTGTATTAAPALPVPPLPFGGPANTLAPPALGTLSPAPAGSGNAIGPAMPIDGDLLAGSEEKKDLKSWETTLAPSRTYPKTKFNYKRVVLPASIYRAQYNGPNRHLPKRLTRADLDKDFLKAVARNDINATRALLNSGRNVNQMNAYGDSALIVAVRAGAYDTARLLIARGANTHFYGQGGKTAFHYARQQGNNDLAKMLIKG